MLRETIRLPPDLIDQAEKAVESGRYPNRSEYYRTIMRLGQNVEDSNMELVPQRRREPNRGRAIGDGSGL